MPNTANTIFNQWLPQYLATLTREVQTTDEPLGYGRDIGMVITNGRLDIDPMRRSVDAFSTRGIGESLLRRLVTPKGRLRRHINYGAGINTLLNRAIRFQDSATIEQTVRQECMKDPRVQDLTIRVTSTLDTLSIEVDVTPHRSSESFTMVFALDGTGKLTDWVLR
jgi:phage baseplate assembly protein W